MSEREMGSDDRENGSFPGKRWMGFTLESIQEKTSYKTTYLAEEDITGRKASIHFFYKRGDSFSDALLGNLRREVSLLQVLRHPGILYVYHIVDENDYLAVVTDWCEGMSLGRLLKNSGAQPWQDVVEWGKQLCDVLAYLHSRQPPIIYRDMKPNNVQLRPDGQVMLVDFATSTAFAYHGGAHSGTFSLGTRGYAAPEQYGGMGEIDGRTDIFCLGATMYHLLTGHDPTLPPYELKPIREINPNLPVWLEQMILKCTQQDPEKRYQSCTELMNDLVAGTVHVYPMPHMNPMERIRAKLMEIKRRKKRKP